MKNKLFIVLISVLPFVKGYAEDILQVTPFATVAGVVEDDWKTFSVEMNNTLSYTALQFDLYLPEGLALIKQEPMELNADRFPGTMRKGVFIPEHNYDCTKMEEGHYYITLYHSDLATIKGNDGELLMFYYETDANMESGYYPIVVSGTVLSVNSHQNIRPKKSVSFVKIGEPEKNVVYNLGDEYVIPSFVTSALKQEKNIIVNDTCENFVLTDGYPCQIPTSFTALKASYTRAATNGLGTLCLPFAAKSVVGSLYELTSAESNKLTFAPVEEAKANTPYLYRSESAVIEETNATVEADAECEIVQGDWTMTGAYSVNVFGSEDNVFALYDGKLYKNTGTLTVNPFRAYFTTTGSASKAEIFIDTPTGIGNVNINENDNENENYYNLNGVRVGKGYRGIVIKNGEKFIMK